MVVSPRLVLLIPYQKSLRAQQNISATDLEASSEMAWSQAEFSSSISDCFIPSQNRELVGTSYGIYGHSQAGSISIIDISNNSCGAGRKACS
jgi:hypothetical protein